MASGRALSEEPRVRPFAQCPGAGGDGDRAGAPQGMSAEGKMAVFDAICTRAMAQRVAVCSDDLADSLADSLADLLVDSLVDSLARTLPTGEPRGIAADPLQELRTCLADYARESHDRLAAHERRVQELLRRITGAENGGPM